MAGDRPQINWTLIQELAVKPHKHLNITADCKFTCEHHGDDHWIGEVEQEARTVQHLCDLAGIPEGTGYDSAIDARVFLLMAEVFALREQLGRIAGWHSRETADGGMVGDFCTECGTRWPCDTQRMATGTYVDEEVSGD